MSAALLCGPSSRLRIFDDGDDPERKTAGQPFHIESLIDLIKAQSILGPLFAGLISWKEAAERLEAIPSYQEPLAPRAPTSEEPGSEAKILEMISRVQRGERPFHDRDKVQPNRFHRGKG